MNRILLAFRCFFEILFHGALSADALGALKLSRREDIASYSDDQVGAAVRELHDQCRDSLARYVALQPVIDGVEGTPVKAPSGDPKAVRFIGNVPAAPPSGGTLRHKGWRAAKVDLPGLAAKEDTTIIAPAEIEIE